MCIGARFVSRGRGASNHDFDIHVYINTHIVAPKKEPRNVAMDMNIALDVAFHWKFS